MAQTPTIENFPPAAQRFLQDLTPPLATNPPALAGLCAQRAFQWHNDRALLKRELDELQRSFSTIAARLEPPNQYLVLRGAFLHTPLNLHGQRVLQSTSFVIWVPADYPQHFPLTWFRSEQTVKLTDDLLPPFEVVTRPYDVPGIHHHPNDGTACITGLGARQEGWDPRHHDLRSYIAWCARYLSNLRVYRETGEWPDDNN